MKTQDLDVLIVDDSRDAADSLTTLMTLQGHRAQAAYSGQEAIEAVAHSRPLCVLLDVHMPDMDGLALVHALREQCGENLVLIAVTGSDADDELAAEVFALVDYHFTKPVSAEALAKVLSA